MNSKDFSSLYFVFHHLFTFDSEAISMVNLFEKGFFECLFFSLSFPSLDMHRKVQIHRSQNVIDGWMDWKAMAQKRNCLKMYIYCHVFRMMEHEIAIKMVQFQVLKYNTHTPYTLCTAKRGKRIIYATNQRLCYLLLTHLINMHSQIHWFSVFSVFIDCEMWEWSGESSDFLTMFTVMWFDINGFEWASRNNTPKTHLPLTAHKQSAVFGFIISYILFYGFIYGWTKHIFQMPYAIHFEVFHTKSTECFWNFWCSSILSHFKLSIDWVHLKLLALIFVFRPLEPVSGLTFTRNKLNWFNWIFRLESLTPGIWFSFYPDSVLCIQHQDV